MKKVLAIVLIFSTFISFPGLTQNLKNKRGWELCSQRKSSLYDSKSPSSAITPKHKFDVLKYTINADLYNCFKGSYPNSFNGSVIVKFRVDSALNTINLNAANLSLVVEWVSMAGTGFTHNNDILTILLDHMYQPGDTAEVKIKYHHLDVTDHAFYASGGFVFTDSEPEGARKWYPCWDSPADKALLDLTAKVPLNAKLGSNGHLQDSIITGDSIYYHWVTRDPLSTYLIVMTGKVNYHLDVVYWTNPNSPSSSPTPIRFYYNNGEDPSQMEAIIGDVCTFFSEKFCPHPFEKNGFATLNNQFSWGGMENQTLTSLCPDCWYESVVVHEFAHQWFGDMITCGTWADVFLNEGFATFLEALWYEHSVSYPRYKSEIDTLADNYLNGNPGWPISQSSWAASTPSVNELFNYAVTYAKGACVLHQLRYVMGDSLFFLGMKNYANDSVNLKYQAALIYDFQSHMEAVYGQNLDWFFNEWIYQPNHPHYSNTYSISNMGNGTWKVGFYTHQTQTNTVFFTMPIEVRVKFTDNTDTIIKVMNDLNGQAFSFYFNKQPNQFYFDPGRKIVLKESSTVVGLDENLGLPAGYLVSQNTPNPASDLTQINYTLPVTADVKLSLFDISGKQLEEINPGRQLPGDHTLTLNTADFNAGIYFYRFEANEYSCTRKMVISR